MDAKGLYATLAGLLLLSQLLKADGPLVLGDREFFTKGSFIAYAAPWSTYEGPNSGLKQGVDFADVITVEKETFPSGSGFTWHWPLAEPKESGVYGYNAVSFGSYDGGEPETPVEPKQIREIRTLEQKFAYEVARPTGDFNVLTEFFLTVEKAGEEKVAEVGFFLRASESAVAFAKAGERVGDFNDREGRKWEAWVQPAPAGPYYMFLPAETVLRGSVDFKGGLDFLRGKDRLTGKEWFNGLAFGVEPVKGSGSLRLQALTVDYR